MKYFLVILGILSVSLFCFNYQICEYFYKDDITKWWGLKQNIYNVIIMMFQTIAFFSVIKSKTMKGLMTFGFIMCGGNVIDRFAFNVNYFQFNDIFFIGLATILSYTVYAKWTGDY